jgi:hypothetical protein
MLQAGGLNRGPHLRQGHLRGKRQRIFMASQEQRRAGPLIARVYAHSRATIRAVVCLGRWQGIYLREHRASKQLRRVVVTVLGA